MFQIILYIYLLPVAGEDDKHKITARCSVTLRVQLQRRSLMDENVLKRIHEFGEESPEKIENNDDVRFLHYFNFIKFFTLFQYLLYSHFILLQSNDDDEAAGTSSKAKQPQRKAWEKPQAKKKKKAPVQDKVAMNKKVQHAHALALEKAKAEEEAARAAEEVRFLK
jgi:hypothetical protein